MAIFDLIIGKVYFAAVFAGWGGIGPQIIKTIIDHYACNGAGIAVAAKGSFTGIGI